MAGKLLGNTKRLRGVQRPQRRSVRRCVRRKERLRQHGKSGELMSEQGWVNVWGVKWNKRDAERRERKRSSSEFCPLKNFWVLLRLISWLRKSKERCVWPKLSSQNSFFSSVQLSCNPLCPILMLPPPNSLCIFMCWNRSQCFAVSLNVKY